MFVLKEAYLLIKSLAYLINYKLHFEILRSAIVIFLTLICISAQSQRFNIDAFRAADGLDTDFIKCVTQDRLGYIWIGTDDGLIKYDGISFIKYFEATKSTYIKDFLFTSDERLLVVHDLGLTEIFNTHDTTYFESVINGNRVVTDTALWYPKALYEDDQNNIWIAEPQSVIRYTNGEWKRFNFSGEFNSRSFVHSFNFTQLNSDSLLISANPGQILYYDYINEKISLIKDVRSSFEIYSMNMFDDELLIGTNKGLVTYDINSEEIKTIIPNHIFSDLRVYNTEELIATTESRMNYFLQKIDGIWRYESIPKTEALTNQAYIAKDRSIWLSTEKGLKILSQKDFHQLVLEGKNQFIEGLISKNSHPYVYAVSKDNIRVIDKETEKTKKLIENKQAYFLSGAIVENDFWASTTSEIIRISDDKIDRKISLTEYGRYIFDLHADAKNMLWIGQEASIGVKKLNPYNLKIEVFDSLRGLSSEITAITSTKDGLFVATTDPLALISYLPNGTDVFKSVELKISENYHQGIVINDLLVIDETIWLGTNFGLFKQENSDLVKIDFDSKFGKGMVRAMTFDGEKIWLGNSMGLFSINTKSLDFSHFDEKSGLPINTINDESILINDNKAWIGTSQGISVMRLNGQENIETIKPFILNMRINGESFKIKERKTNTLPHNAFIEMSYASMTFPSSKVYYSYRLDSGKWSRPDNINYAEFSNLIAGDHRFEVRAKKMGNYNWSDSAQFNFNVQHPFYLHKGFLIALLGLIIFLIALTREVTKRVERKRNKELKALVKNRTSELSEYKNSLERLVNDRTAELESAYKEIQETQNQLIHTEKMASLGVLTAGIAHEINNPINYVQGGLYSIKAILEEAEESNLELSTSTDEMKEVVQNMQVGVDRITRIVASLSRFSRKDGDQMTTCNVVSILESCLLILNHEISNDVNIVMDFEIEEALIIADEGKIHQLFVNLLSNAVHALEKDGTIKIRIVNTSDSVNVHISDNGTGISEGDMRKIYDPFFTTKPPGKGTGLGLFITHKVVEDHGGKIKFKSVLGKGTTVFIKFKKNQSIDS